MKASAKEAVLLILLSSTGCIFWLSVARLLPKLTWHPDQYWWSALISAFLLTVLWGITVILVDRLTFTTIAWALVSYIGVVWFTDPVFIGIATLLFLSGIVGFLRTKAEMQRVLGGLLIRPMRRAVPLMVTMLVAAFAAAAYLKTPSQLLVLERIVPESTFNKMIVVAEPLIRQFNPAFRQDISFADYMVASAERSAAKHGITLTQVQKNLIVDEAKSEAEKDFGFEIKPHEPLTRVFYTLVAGYLKRQAQTYQFIFHISYALILFTTLRLLMFPVMFVALACAVGILRILRRLGIVELRALPATLTAYSFK